MDGESEGGDCDKVMRAGWGEVNQEVSEQDQDIKTNSHLELCFTTYS